MNPTVTARRLRREQRQEEKALWKALRAGRFAGFKFRRQHPLGEFFLDFYCPIARLSIELDGSQHGFPEQRQRDEARAACLAAEGIEELRFWNRQWRENREGVLLEIWHALHRRTGCVKVVRKEQNHRFVPPNPAQLADKPPQPARLLPRQGYTSSPQPSPPWDGGGGRSRLPLSPRGTSGERDGERGANIRRLVLPPGSVGVSRTREEAPN